jgi:hypothetical protein
VPTAEDSEREPAPPPRHPAEPAEQTLAAEKGEERPSPPPGNGEGAAAESGPDAEAEAAEARRREEPAALPGEAEPKAEPAYPVLTVTQKPANPRKGWWQRLMPPADRTPGEA